MGGARHRPGGRWSPCFGCWEGRWMCLIGQRWRGEGLPAWGGVGCGWRTLVAARKSTEQASTSRSDLGTLRRQDGAHRGRSKPRACARLRGSKGGTVEGGGLEGPQGWRGGQDAWLRGDRGSRGATWLTSARRRRRARCLRAGLAEAASARQSRLAGGAAPWGGSAAG
eukprot:3803212-Prymnesium_polylepis.1